MICSSHRTRSKLVVCAHLICAALLLAALGACLVTTSAWAAGPATVTVRVLGPAPNYEPLTPLTQVTTTTAPVTKDGGSCSGASAAGALELATKGNWEGNWSSKYLDYEVTSIDGKSFPFEESSPANYYWSFWLNDKYSEQGVCEPELEAGEQVLFVPACYGTGCPPPANVLAIETPATAEVGKPTTITVLSYPNAGGEPKPLSGATVTGWGSSAETNPEGHATLIFPGDATYTLRATAASAEDPESVPGEALVCAHNGNDGTCGTQAPSSSSSPSTSTTPTSGVLASVAYKGEYALVPKLTSVIEGRDYSRRHAPRVLSGEVLAHAAVTSVSLTLRREYKGRCYAFDGVSTRFVRARCGVGRPFKVSDDGTFSYLLPEALEPGRYVLDIVATDAEGNYTTLARGTSRIVFYVE